MMWRIEGPFWDVSETLRDLEVDGAERLPLLASPIALELALEQSTPETIALVEKAARRYNVRLTRLELLPRPRTENDPPETTGRPPSGR